MLPALAYVPQNKVIKGYQKVERWHNCFSSTLNSFKHPSIWRFIHVLQKEESINTLKIQQYVAGPVLPVL